MQATSYIIETGITDILYFYNSNSYSAVRKLSGYQSALTQKGLPIRREYMQYYKGNHSNLSAISKFLTELDSSIKFGAIIAGDDNLAIGAVKYAHQRGISIPQDLSIIGYNNSLLSTCCEPELTSVDNRLETLCHHIVKTLIGILNGQEMPQKVIFSGELIKRGTTL
jgi:LacI family transcriptional regulator/LacI family asc operon transcriptional repressor